MYQNKTLYQLPLFWIMLTVPLVLGMGIAIAITWHSFVIDGYMQCWSADCINDALVMLKLPIAISALAFPLVALVASHHRSVQTAAQIQATESKNAFENCIKHQEIFFEFIERLEEKYRLRFLDKHKLYDSIFKSNNYREFNFYADASNRDVYYYSIFYGEEKLAKDTCLVFPLIEEINLLLAKNSRTNFTIAEKKNFLIELYMALDEFSFAFYKVGIKLESGNLNRRIESLKDENLNKFFDFFILVLSNAFMEIFEFCLSDDFLNSSKYSELIITLNHSINKIQEVNEN